MQGFRASSRWRVACFVVAWASSALFPSPGPRHLAAAAVAQNPPVTERRQSPPVILISVDTLRADRLSCYGYKGLATPRIDRMAEGGTLFAQVSSQVPLTLPSHASLLTSTYPFANGIEDNGEQLAPNAVTLGSVLKSQGYRTAAFVGGFVLDRRFGLDQGFDLYDSPFNLRRQAGKDPGDIKRFGEDVTAAATRWLEQNADRPFFVFLHLYDLHTPYELPPAERRRGSSYEAELGYVDEVLGKFWDFLEQRGLSSRALVVFTSDHGESLGEHGEGTHGYFIYQSTLRVPLIIHGPAGSGSEPGPSEHGPAARRVDEPVSLLDVAPTVLQLVGVARPREFQGRSLVGLMGPMGLTGSPNSAARKSAAAEEIYSESLYAHNHFGTSALRSLRAGRYKYVEAPRPEFYDLASDPSETQNLYASQKSLAATFRDQLAALRARFRSESPAGSRALSPEAVERLASLGYVAVSRARSGSSESGADPKDRIADYETYGRAIALASAGHLSEANAALRQLLEKDPNLLDVRASLGLNEQKLGRHAEAAESFRAVLKQDPLRVLAHFDLGVSEYALGRRDEAVKELEATLALAPYYTRAEELLATLWLEKMDYARARAHLDHLLTVDPADYAAHYNLGALDTLDGNWQDGERHLRAALDTDPSSAEAHNTLGSLYLRRGELEQARQEFAEAIRLDSKFAGAHYNLGMIFRRQQKNEEAAREFREALAADPQFRPAREALDRLKSSTGRNP